MNYKPVFLCILLLIVISVTGCTLPPTAMTNTTNNPISTNQASSPPEFIKFPANSTTNSTKIPVLLTDTDWKIAGDCGWTPDNLPETAALFMNDCQVRRLLSDGGDRGDWLRYELHRQPVPDVNTPGCDRFVRLVPRCRATLAIRTGIMKTELMAT